MAINIPSQSEIEQFFEDIDELEGYTYNEWLDYMEDEYPNVDAAELYRSKGENIVTGYRDIKGNFVAGEEPEIDPEIQTMIDNMPTGIDRMNEELLASALQLDAQPELSQAEKSAAFMQDLRAKALNPDDYSSIMSTDSTPSGMLTDEEIMAEDTPINSADPLQIAEGLGDLAESQGLPAWAGVLIGSVVTKNPKNLLKPKSRVLKEKDGMLSTKNSRILKSQSDEAALAARIKAGNIKKKGPSTTVSTKNSTILKPKDGNVSAKHSRVLKETTPTVSTKNSTILKPNKNANTDVIAKQANVQKVSTINKNRKLTRKEKLVAGGITTAATIAALTNKNGLTGNRTPDGSFAPYPTDIHPPIATPKPEAKPTKPVKPEVKPEVTISAKPGWFQGSTVEGKDDGNYWSADFDDEYWNTPAGVKEAIGVWGRPIGNRIGNPIKWN